MQQRARRTMPRARFDRAALGFLAGCVVGLYVAAALAPAVPPSETGRGDAAPAAPARGEAARMLAGAEDWAAPRTRRGGVLESAGVVSVANAQTLTALFSGMGYSLDRVRRDGHLVPRVFPAHLPSDLERIDRVDLRKAVFLKAMLPLVLKVNERVLLERGRVLALRAREESGRGLTSEDREWLHDLARRYGLEGVDLDRLLDRLDVIPPSLALAQAAEESGWGTSRFVREGNAAFGQWTFDPEQGLAPRDREEGADHFVRVYEHLLEGVWAYTMNLNTHPAYRDFRRLRAEKRRQGRDLDGYELAGTLKHYAERGQAYIKSVREIIRANDLGSLDGARLRGTVLVNLASAGR